MGMSATFPGVSANATGCRDHRPRHGFCSFFRRANGQSLPRTPPFRTGRRAVRLDMAAGDGKLVRNGTSGRHFLENALPDTALGPTIVAVVYGRRWPIGWRNVAPAVFNTCRMPEMTVRSSTRGFPGLP